MTCNLCTHPVADHEPVAGSKGPDFEETTLLCSICGCVLVIRDPAE